MAHLDRLEFFDSSPVARCEAQVLRDHQKVVAILFLALTPLVFKTALTAPWLEKGIMIGMIVSFGGALWAVSEGLRARAEYDAAIEADAPRAPMILVGSLWLGGTAAGLAIYEGFGPGVAGLAGLAVAGLATVAFGRDPMRAKGREAADDWSRQTADTLLASTDRRVEVMTARIAAVQDEEVQTAMAHLRKSVEGLQTKLREDPSHVRQVAPKLGPHLDSAVEATRRFASIYPYTRNAEAKAYYLRVLTVLATLFETNPKTVGRSGNDQICNEVDGLIDRLVRDRLAA